ncbi:General stress protein A [Dyadobacter sp. CECT 9275]|uniref:General stress protein A n=1 Tax=Dyadobacter helix TaxID=2822344 RepID=A0A916NL98_9BACT|nr:glycosyltransferase family 8 protein [Dyadobacter sp. CECT 9275]CAG4999707.1 General stress protein A [Dyadobacter sp. CECT 9275]
MDDKIHVACTIDSSYIQHCCVMLTSLFQNNKIFNFHIHLITDQESRSKFFEIERIVVRYGSTFSHYAVDQNLLSNVPVNGHVSIVTYYRILIPLILDYKIPKVLFLDSDVIIRTNILALWCKSVTDFHIAAAKDFASEEHKKLLNIPGGYPYFNAGVLLMNLTRWRNDNISAKILQYISDNHEKIVFWDQDALNAILYKSCKIFSPLWNLTHGFFLPSATVLGYSDVQLKFFTTYPFIVHFTGSNKPWYHYNEHTYKKDYFFYLSQTPYKYFTPIGKPFRTRTLGDKIIYILRRLHFIK